MQLYLMSHYIEIDFKDNIRLCSTIFIIKIKFMIKKYLSLRYKCKNVFTIFPNFLMVSFTLYKFLPLYEF